MSTERQVTCPECEGSVSRREFVRSVGAVAAGAAGMRLMSTPQAIAAPNPSSPAETMVKAFYDSLNEEQKKIICMPFDHSRRKRINANWQITKATIGELFSKKQQGMIDQIFRGVTSPDGYERFQKQMKEDAGGFDEYTVAIFGTPGSGKFEWEMTGRHLTIRADGNSVENTAFGGPIIYGHGTGDGKAGLPGNVFFYQTQRANEVFNALDGKQRKKALLSNAPRETNVPIQGRSGTFPGIAVGELSDDQKGLVEEVIKVILAPYREADVDEAMGMLKAAGGLDELRMAFYNGDKNDVGNDQVWDVWRIEGPTFVSHFRGAPHVHAYLNVGVKA